MEISPQSRLDGIVAMMEATFPLCTSMAKRWMRNTVDRVWRQISVKITPTASIMTKTASIMTKTAFIMTKTASIMTKTTSSL